MVDLESVKPIALAIFDVAGTTAQDGGLVVEAFQSAMEVMGVARGSADMDRMTDYVNFTMGERKIDVFMHLCDGDSARADLAHDRFVESYIALVKAGRLEEFEGVSALFTKLRNGGTAVAITTGFPRDILDTVIAGLKWAPIIDFSVAADEVAHGRPAPDMIFRCLDLYNKKFGTHISGEDIAIIGDTESDMRSGVTAGAKIIAGVASGAHSPDQLSDAGATHVLGLATELPTIC
jgi:phosphonatase-like hydrolase